MVSATIAQSLSAPWGVAALVALLTMATRGPPRWAACIARFKPAPAPREAVTLAARRAAEFEAQSIAVADNGDRHLTRDEAVEALRRAEAKYRGIFENAIEGIFQTSPDGRYLSANPALARIYDYDSPEHLMASIGDIERQLYVDPQRRERVRPRHGVAGVCGEFRVADLSPRRRRDLDFGKRPRRARRATV